MVIVVKAGAGLKLGLFQSVLVNLCCRGEGRAIVGWLRCGADARERRNPHGCYWCEFGRRWERRVLRLWGRPPSRVVGTIIRARRV